MSINLKQMTRAAGVLAVGILLIGATTAQARGRGPGGRGGPGMGGMGFHPEMLEAVASELGVDKATLSKIKDLSYKTHKEQIAIRGELENAHLDMRRMMDEDKPNVDAVMRQVDKIGALETKAKKNKIRLMLTVRGMLTPDQRDKLGKIMAERRANRRGPPGGGPGMGHGRGPGMGGGGPGMGYGRGPGMGAGDGPRSGRKGR